MIKDVLINVACPFLGTVAYVALFNVPRRYYLSCGVTGIVAWLVYLGMSEVVSAAVASFLAVMAAVFLSRMLAVRMKCPITIFLLAAILPLVPGAGIYYTAYYLVTDQLSMAAERGIGAVKVAFGIVVGIAFVVSIPAKVFQIHYWRGRKRRKRLKDIK